MLRISVLFAEPTAILFGSLEDRRFYASRMARALVVPVVCRAGLPHASDYSFWRSIGAPCFEQSPRAATLLLQSATFFKCQARITSKTAIIFNIDECVCVCRLTVLSAASLRSDLETRFGAL